VVADVTKIVEKRLRKKHYKGEFRQLGYELRISLKDGLTERRFDAFLNDLIDFVEAHNLGSGGLALAVSAEEAHNVT
jgi:uncharacterized protein YggL (DUF469 family)